MTNRSYEQYCPIAAALDVLGTRWTLLILRELTMRPRRFTDLKLALAGVAPNLLAERFRELQEAGLVEQRAARPGGHPEYLVTPAGREVVPVLRALARFGVDRLQSAGDDAEIRPEMAVYAMVAPYHEPEPHGVRFHARLHVDGRTFDLVTDGAELSLRRCDDTPDLEFEISARELVAARQGSGLPRAGSVEGERFARLFQLT